MRDVSIFLSEILQLHYSKHCSICQSLASKGLPCLHSLLPAFCVGCWHVCLAVALTWESFVEGSNPYFLLNFFLDKMSHSAIRLLLSILRPSSAFDFVMCEGFGWEVCLSVLFVLTGCSASDLRGRPSNTLNRQISHYFSVLEEPALAGGLLGSLARSVGWLGETIPPFFFPKQERRETRSGCERIQRQRSHLSCWGEMMAPLLRTLSMAWFVLCPTEADTAGIKHFEGNEWCVTNQHCCFCSLRRIHCNTHSSSWRAQQRLLGEKQMVAENGAVDTGGSPQVCWDTLFSCASRGLALLPARRLLQSESNW